MKFKELGLLSSVNLTDQTPEQAATFIIKQVNEMVPNSNTRNCTPGLDGDGQPLVFGISSVKLVENKTMEYNRIIDNYRKKIAQNLLAVQDVTSHMKAKLGLIAREAISTRCGDCQEMAYVGAFVLRNNGYQGKISIGVYGPENDADAEITSDQGKVVIDKHLFLILDRTKTSSPDAWVADIWAKKSFPYSEWKNYMRGYGTTMQMKGFGGECYGYLVPPEKIPKEEPRLYEPFSYYFPPLSSKAWKQKELSSAEKS